LCTSQGNWGNTLLALGQLKAGALEALQDGPPPPPGAEDAEAVAEARLRADGERALREAGEKYRALMERDPADARALWNWARAMMARAELADDVAVRAP
jgi:hypothetical protein